MLPYILHLPSLPNPSSACPSCPGVSSAISYKQSSITGHTLSVRMIVSCQINWLHVVTLHVVTLHVVTLHIVTLHVSRFNASLFPLLAREKLDPIKTNTPRCLSVDKSLRNAGTASNGCRVSGNGNPCGEIG